MKNHCFLAVIQLPRNAQHYAIWSKSFPGIARFFYSLFSSHVRSVFISRLGKCRQCRLHWLHNSMYVLPDNHMTPGSPLNSHIHQWLGYIVCCWLTASRISELEWISCLSLLSVFALSFLLSFSIIVEFWLTCINTCVWMGKLYSGLYQICTKDEQQRS